MIEFIKTAYMWLVPILLLVSFFVTTHKKNILLQIIAANNICLILLCIFQWVQLWNLFQSLLAFQKLYPQLAAAQDKENMFSLSNHFFIMLTLGIIIPFFFLIKKLRTNRLLITIELIALWWGTIWIFVKHLINGNALSSSDGYVEYHLSFKILNYFSLLTGMYALLWLLKKKQPQQAIN
jgi:hypothetical protein